MHSNKNNWRTPQWLWLRLHEVFDFEIDGASDGTNHLLPNYHTKNTPQETIISDYSNKRIFINPPFNELNSSVDWLSHATLCYDTGLINLLVYLIPLAPETKPFTAWVWPYAKVFIFNKRINYVDPLTNRIKKGVRFPSCLAVYTKSEFNSEILKDLGVWK